MVEPENAAKTLYQGIMKKKNGFTIRQIKKFTKIMDWKIRYYLGVFVDKKMLYSIGSRNTLSYKFINGYSLDNICLITDIDGTLIQNRFQTFAHEASPKNNKNKKLLESSRLHSFIEPLFPFFRMVDLHFITYRNHEIADITRRWIEKTFILEKNDYELHHINYQDKESRIDDKLQVIDEIFIKSGKKYLIFLDDDMKFDSIFHDIHKHDEQRLIFKMFDDAIYLEMFVNYLMNKKSESNGLDNIISASF